MRQYHSFKYTKANQRLAKFLSHPEFQEDILKIRKKWGLVRPSTKFQNSYGQLKKLMNTTSFADDVHLIKKKYKLDDEWLFNLESYIILHIFYEKDFIPRALRLEEYTDTESDPITGEPIYYLKIYSHTTLEEIKQAWKDITKIVKNGVKTKERFSKEFERDRDIFKWTNEDKTIEEIYGLILKKYKQDMDYGAIKKAESDYRLKMKIGNMYRKNKLKSFKPKSYPN